MRSSWLSLSVLLVAWGAGSAPLVATGVPSPAGSVAPALEQVGFGIPIPGLGGQPKQQPPPSNSSPANSGSTSQPQGIRQATVTEILDGPQVFIETRQAKVRDVAKLKEQVRTGDSRTQLIFNTGAVGRLSQNAQVIIGDQCFRLRQGKILVNGPQSACTRSKRLSVRGTTYSLEVLEDESLQVSVWEGEVQVEAAAPSDSEPDAGVPTEAAPAPPDAAPVVLRSGERLIITPQGLIGQILKLTLGDYETILNGNFFQGFNTRLPGIPQLETVFSELFPGATFPTLPTIPSIPAVPSIPTPVIPNIPSLPGFGLF
jgi:hypothetical protein